MRVAIYTLGCRLNFAETEEWADLLVRKGYEFSFHQSRLIIIRGCSVTRKAEKETKIKIKEIRKKEKKSFIIATGCLKKSFTTSAADLILPKEKEKNLLAEVEKIFKESQSRPEKRELKLRTRSFIKIQDGCQRYCSYCLIPYLRGKEESKASKEIIKQIKEKEKIGYQEVVLTGVNIGQWQEKPQRDLAWLLQEIFKKTNIPRIRISSLWPNALNDKLIFLFKNNRLCRHLHLSLQSLSDSVLKKMGRNYSSQEIKNKIGKIKKLFPDLTLTADIIVGFPGESEKEFEEAYKDLKKIGLAKIHVFRYSVREGTAAARFPHQIEEKDKRRRARRLLSLSRELEKNWRKKFLGKKRKVLFEQKKNNFWQGLTDNYLKVFVESKENLKNQILPVKLKKLYKEGLIGNIIETNGNK